MIKSLFLGTIKYVFFDLIFDFLYFPLWWYSSGLITASRNFLKNLRYGLQSTGLKIWLLNLFRPMFGEITWQGRLISFAMRLLFLIFKTITMVFWVIFSLVIFLLWLIIPPFVICMITKQV